MKNFAAMSWLFTICVLSHHHFMCWLIKKKIYFVLKNGIKGKIVKKIQKEQQKCLYYKCGKQIREQLK
jgi:hypothetical protein